MNRSVQTLQLQGHGAHHMWLLHLAQFFMHLMIPSGDTSINLGWPGAGMSSDPTSCKM